MKKKFLCFCFLVGFVTVSHAQQYVWAQNNGAGSSLNSAVSISPTLNPLVSGGVAQNETWTVFSTGSATRFRGAGNGVAPDVGPVEKPDDYIGRYDANMNLVWYCDVPSYVSRIAADPRANDQFYMTTIVKGSGSWKGFSWSGGQAGVYSVLLLKCKAGAAPNSVTVLWGRKIDGPDDDQAYSLQVKDIGGGHTRIVVGGGTRSTKISTYTNAASAVAQTTNTSVGATDYDQFIACYDEDVIGVKVTPLWINAFGASGVSEKASIGLELSDDGSVQWPISYTSNSLGTVNYTLNTSAGTSTNYPANISSSRYILFSMDGSTGSTLWVKNELANSAASVAPCGLVSDAAGNLYMGGSFSSKYTAATGISITSAGGNDACIVVFDKNGTVLRAQRYGNSGNQIFKAGPNSTALDRTNNRVYLAFQNNSTFTAGSATVQALSSYDGALLAVDALGSMNALSGASCIGTTSGTTEAFGSVAVRSDGNVVATQQYAVGGYNLLNAGSSQLLPKTAFGYIDNSITQFSGNAGELLKPIAEGDWGGTTANIVYSSTMAAGQLLSAGSFSGTMVVGGVTVSSSAGAAYDGGLVTLTDTATGAIKAVHSLVSTSNPCNFNDVKVSPVDGSIYICGRGYSDLSYDGVSLGKGATLGNYDAFVMKLDASYRVIWTAYIGGTQIDVGQALSIDPVTGDVYVAGYFASPTLQLNPAGGNSYNSAIIATNKVTSAPYTQDLFVAKFNAAGAMQWITAGGTPSATVSEWLYHGLEMMDGSLYLGGYGATNSAFSFGGKSLNLSSTGSETYDMVLTKLDPVTGQANWIKGWTGDRSDCLSTLAADNGLLYIGGYSNSTSGMTLGGTPFSYTGVSYDPFVFAVDGDGNEQAGLVQLKGNMTETIYDLKADGAGTLYFSGHANSSSLPVAGVTLSSNGGTFDVLTGAIDEVTMTPKWAFLNGSAADDFGRSITPGKLGSVFVGGQLAGTATFGGSVVKGRLGGDFLYGRIDYPYIAPGAQVGALNTWFKGNGLVSGNPASQWGNSANNSVLNNLTTTGSVLANDTGSNFNPTLKITGGRDYLSLDNIYSTNAFNGSGTSYSVYVVLKPSSKTDKVTLWSETANGTGVSLGAAANTVTGVSSSKTATNTKALALDKYSVTTLAVSGSTMTNYLNGSANGSSTGVSALNTTNSGTFAINGTGTMDVAEVVTYGGYHAPGNYSMNRVETYLGIKYGITLGHHYYSTLGDTLYKVDNGYPNNIAGIGIDSAEVLIQKQGRAQDSANKGNMLTIGMGTIAINNISNNAVPAQDNSYLVWGDNGGSVTTTQTTNLSNTASSCANRLPRAWKIQRTHNGIGHTQVKLDLNKTVSLAAYSAADVQLMIDKDGDGNFATGSTELISATSLTDNVATFNNVVWDEDGNGSDVFAVVFNNKIPKPFLVGKGVTETAERFGCNDVSGANVFVDNAALPAKKYVAINPRGNTGYDFTVTAVNNAPVVNNKMVTNHTTQTTAFANRMFIIKDNGANNYPSGMTVRVYYNPQDSVDAVNALDPAVTAGTLQYRWFKYPGTSVNAVTAAQGLAGINGATWLTPSAYGEESGVNYVEFDGIESFSVFGSMAGRGVVVPLPLKLLSFEANKQAGSVNISLLSWVVTDQVNMSSFVVERSTDGKQYTEIVNKAAAGNYADHMTYTFTDANAISGINFYRLKMVNIDGSYTYSAVKTVTFDVAATANLYLAPNPSRGQFYVKGLTSSSTVHILDMSGRVLQTYKGMNQYTMLNITSLPASTYLVQVIDEGRFIGTFKLVKE
ncbi:T9SS type A sorting domain-containing protein [Chitinophagaceae bacterium 26-R-25]|nr:T9SS type A sorting domain-containing protein [Chitinophagaceae bacterium 26-R-25]